MSFFKNCLNIFKKKNIQISVPLPQPFEKELMDIKQIIKNKQFYKLNYEILNDHFLQNKLKLINEIIDHALEQNMLRRLSLIISLSAKFNAHELILKIIQSNKSYLSNLFGYKIDGKTAIMNMFINQMWDCLEILLSMFSHDALLLTSRDDNNNNLLHYVVHSFEPKFYFLIDTFSKLLHKQNKQQLTPLSVALMINNCEIIHIILNYGHDNYKDLLLSNYFSCFSNHLTQNLMQKIISNTQFKLLPETQYYILRMIYNNYDENDRNIKYQEWFVMSLRYSYPLKHKKKDCIVECIKNKNYDLLHSLFKTLKLTPKKIIRIINQESINEDIIEEFNENYIFGQCDPVCKIDI